MRCRLVGRLVLGYSNRYIHVARSRRSLLSLPLLAELLVEARLAVGPEGGSTTSKYHRAAKQMRPASRVSTHCITLCRGKGGGIYYPAYLLSVFLRPGNCCRVGNGVRGVRESWLSENANFDKRSWANGRDAVKGIKACTPHSQISSSVMLKSTSMRLYRPNLQRSRMVGEAPQAQTG